MENNKNNYGLSRKTNIAIAGITGVTVAKDVIHAVIAVVIIVLIGLTYQFVIDRNNGKNKSTN